MRLSAGEKYKIIQAVTTSEIGVKRTLESFGIARSTFTKWYQKYYLENGYEGLKRPKRTSKKTMGTAYLKNKRFGSKIALEHTELSSRELAHKITDEQSVFISESSVYRILKAMDLIRLQIIFYFQQPNEFKDKTEFVHQMWQTDFTLFQSYPGWAGTI